MADLLLMEKFHGLPHPLCALFFGGSTWEIHDIDVETGMVRINVSGILDVTHFGSVRTVIDANGDTYDADEFYNEVESLEELI